MMVLAFPSPAVYALTLANATLECLLLKYGTIKIMKSFFTIFITVIIGFAATVGTYMVFHKQHVQLLSPLSPTHFSLANAPTDSLIGTISALSGTVSWQSRIADNPVTLQSPRQIQQGESLFTGSDGSLALTFPTIATITLLKNSQINIIQTLPVNVVIQQIDGTVTYIAQSSTTPLSIRALDLLTTSTNGQVIISVDKVKSLITLSVVNGSATIAYTDTNNKSQVMTLAVNKKIIFNNNTKKVLR